MTTATATPTAELPVRRIVAIDAEVLETQRISKNFLRIIFGGADMAGFGPQRHPLDLRIKLLIPQDTDTIPMIDTSTDGWYQQWLATDPETRGIMRTYTVREVYDDGAGRRIAVDFVLHFDESGHGGPAANWAMNAKPGDHLCIVGPNRADPSPGGIEFDPEDARRLLLVGDETAAPAIASILASEPELEGDVFVEVPCAEDIFELPTVPGISVNWLVRGDAEHGERLISAVRRSLGLDCHHEVCAGSCVLDNLEAEMVAEGAEGSEPASAADVVWETPVYSSSGEELEELEEPEEAPHESLYAWVAGEAAMVKHLRRCMVRERGMGRHQVAFMGYWRRGVAEA